MVNERHAILIAHGQPSNPMQVDKQITELAEKINLTSSNSHDPFPFHLLAASLANPASLDAAIRATIGDALPPLVIPMMMSDGWLNRHILPQRLAAIESSLFAVPQRPQPLLLPPIGLAVQELASMTANHLANLARIPSSGGEREIIMIVAHGSSRRPDSHQSLYDFVAELTKLCPQYAIEYGFLFQPPFLKDKPTAIAKASYCVPFFAFAGDHVTHDVQEVLKAHQFQGHTLPPLGLMPGIESVIRRMLIAHTTDSATPP